jgi:hypothetical protein
MRISTFLWRNRVAPALAESSAWLAQLQRLQQDGEGRRENQRQTLMSRNFDAKICFIRHEKPGDSTALWDIVHPSPITARDARIKKGDPVDRPVE